KPAGEGGVRADNPLVHSPRHQFDEYLCAGGGPETWQPRFSYKGFRYVQVTGLPRPPRPEEILGCQVHSQVRETGSFGCSEPPIERYAEMMRRSVRGNLHGIPTDTPMYEKNGWTGDLQLGAASMARDFAMPRLFTKWLGDVADSPDEAGQLPVI